METEILHIRVELSKEEKEAFKETIKKEGYQTVAAFFRKLIFDKIKEK